MTAQTQECLTHDNVAQVLTQQRNTSNNTTNTSNSMQLGKNTMNATVVARIDTIANKCLAHDNDNDNTSSSSMQLPQTQSTMSATADVVADTSEATTTSNKRSRVQAAEELVAPLKRQRIRRVHWADKPQFVEADPDANVGMNHADIWYTRQEYEDFLVDRLRTVKCLRASGGNDKALDPKKVCLRGLEPFQNAEKHQEMHDKRQFHSTTILIEQVRQSRLGTRDPERFQLLVAPQSEWALRRAQELAALDEHEVYRKVCRRRSLLSVPTKSTDTNTSSTEAMNDEILSLSSRIKRLQEWNEKRLKEIYQQSTGSGVSRFQIRRDSLFRGNGNGTGRMGAAAVAPSRFPTRRASLGPGPLR